MVFKSTKPKEVDWDEEEQEEKEDKSFEDEEETVAEEEEQPVRMPLRKPVQDEEQEQEQETVQAPAPVRPKLRFSAYFSPERRGIYDSATNQPLEDIHEILAQILNKIDKIERRL